MKKPTWWNWTLDFGFLALAIINFAYDSVWIGGSLAFIVGGCFMADIANWRLSK